MNSHAVSRVPLSPQVVDGIVFWTKNPAPMLKRLDALQDYPYYFQFTLTPYGADIEKRLPPKNEIVAHLSEAVCGDWKRAGCLAL